MVGRWYDEMLRCAQHDTLIFIGDPQQVSF
jgi:hypothetical protein